MTSIAASLASLIGAAPQEGQNVTLANATGAVGLFAALLDSSNAAQGTGGENTLSLDTNGLDLLGDGADIDAAIIEGLPPDQAVQGGALPAESQGPAPHNTQAHIQPAAPQALEETPAGAVFQSGTTPVEARAQQQNQAPGETRATPTGLENAFERASKMGRDNGLQTALKLATQARGADQPDTSRSEFAPKGSEINQSLVKSGNGQSIIQSLVKSGNGQSINQSPVKSGNGQSINQSPVKSGNGQSIIQIQERPGGENAGATSPPTLTASVQAPAASPGPASANAPHVPVSALAVHIAQQASNGAKRFDIRLDPPELGRIEVRIDVSREGQVTTHLVVERAETLDLLQRDARQLERALQEAGLDMSEEGMKFSLKDQGFAEGGDERFDGEDDMGTAANNSEDDDPPHIPGTDPLHGLGRPRYPNLGRLDNYG